MNKRLLIILLLLIAVPAFGANVTYYGIADSGTNVGSDTTDSSGCNTTETTVDSKSLMEQDTTNYCASKEVKVRFDPATNASVTWYWNTAYGSAMTVDGNGTAALGTMKCKAATGTGYLKFIDYDPSTGTHSVADSVSWSMASGSGYTTQDISGISASISNGNKLAIKAEIICDSSTRVEMKYGISGAGKEFYFPVSETASGGGAARRRMIIMQ